MSINEELSRDKALEVIERAKQFLAAGQPLGTGLRTNLWRARKTKAAHPEYGLPEIPVGKQGGARKRSTPTATGGPTLAMAPTPPNDVVKPDKQAEQLALQAAKTAAKAAQRAEQEAERAKRSVLDAAAERVKAFSKVFGNLSRYRIMDSVLKGLQAEGFAFTTREEVLAFAGTCREFRLKHPEYRLPKLIFRQESETATQQHYNLLRTRPDLERYEFPYDTLPTYDGLLVTGAQFDGEVLPPFWKTLKEVYLPFKAAQEGRRYALAALPIVFGKVDLTFNSELDRFELAGTFAEELRGHMVLRDTRFKDSTLLKVMRMQPALEGSYLTDNLLNSLQRESAELTLLAAPVVELKHRAQPGLELGDNDPRIFATTGTVTIPDYGRDNLGLASRRASISTFDTTFSFWVVDVKDGKPQPREVLDVHQDGTFYDWVKVRGDLRCVKFSPHGAEVVSDALDTLGTPDAHTGYADAPVRQAFLGEGGILPTLKPKLATLDDFIDSTAISPFLDDDVQTRLWLKSTQFRTIREKMAFPDDLDKWLKKHGVWRANLSHAESELRLCGIELLHLARCCPQTELVYKPANHNDWLDKAVWHNTKWRDENFFLMARLVTMMEKEMRQAEKQYAEMAAATMGVGRTYLERFVRQEGKAFGVEAGQFKFLNRLQTFARPTNAKEPIEIGRHGDQPRFRGKALIVPSAGMRVMINHFHSGEIGRNYRVNGVMGRRRHYMRESTTNWSYSTNLIFKSGQQMMLHPKQNGTWWAY